MRRFVREHVDKLEAKEILETLERHLRDVPELPRGTAARWLRANHNSH